MDAIHKREHDGVQAPNRQYRQLIDRVREVVRTTLPTSATVVVVSRGDDVLLDLGGRPAWHFPREASGVYAGHYPGDGDEAVRHVEAARDDGGDVLLFPSTAYWWLDAYPELREHLEHRARLVLSPSDTCLIFDLGGAAAAQVEPDQGERLATALATAEACTAAQRGALRLEGAGYVGQARKVLASALEQAPDALSLIDEYVRLSILVGDLAAPREVLLRATAANGALSSARVLLAKLALAAGDLDEALTAAQGALRLDPDQQDAARIRSAIRGLRSVPAKTGPVIDLISHESAAGNVEFAERYAAVAIALAANDERLRLEPARLALQRGRFGAAEQQLTHLVQQFPGDPAPLNGLIDLLLGQIDDGAPGRDSSVLDRLLAQLEIPGRDRLITAENHLRLTETLGSAGRSEPALASLRAALQRLDFTSDAVRGYTARLLRQFVAEEWRIPFDNGPALATFLTHAGHGFASVADPIKAEACHVLAAAANPAGPAAGFNLGFRALARGDVTGAWSRFSGATRIYAEDTAQIAWPSREGRAWPHHPFGLAPAFDALKPAGATWPTITVITPSFNQAAYVEETILSVLHQEYPSVEYIVVDGMSTDETQEILERYRDRISTLIVEPDSGQTEALNKGLRLANGEIVLWVNSDDMLAPGALFMVALNYLEDDADVIAGFCLEHTARRFGLINLPRVSQATFHVEYLGDLFGRWLKGEYFYQPEVAFSRRILAKVGGLLNEDLHYTMDYEFWLRAALAGARVSVVHWPVGLFRKHEQQKTADLTTCIIEQGRVRDRFVIPRPSFERKLEIRRRLRRARASASPEVTVVSTRAAKIFSSDTGPDLAQHFEREGLPISFRASLDTANLDETGLLILLVHLNGEQDTLRRLREAGYDGPVVGWFWDNHHQPFENFEATQGLDVCLPGHGFAASYLRSPRCLLGPTIPLCTTQWGTVEAQTYFGTYGLDPRSDDLYGGFVRYALAGKRNALIERLIAEGMEDLDFLQEDSLTGYFGMAPKERFASWAAHKVSLCLPLAGDLSQRLFDALLTGQVPIVAPDIHDLDAVIPPALQAELPIVRFAEYSPGAVREAYARALRLFDVGGSAAVRRRHLFALRNHMFTSRIRQILSSIDGLLSGQAGSGQAPTQVVVPNGVASATAEHERRGSLGAPRDATGVAS